VNKLCAISRVLFRSTLLDAIWCVRATCVAPGDDLLQEDSTRAQRLNNANQNKQTIASLLFCDDKHEAVKTRVWRSLGTTVTQELSTQYRMLSGSSNEMCMRKAQGIHACKMKHLKDVGARIVAVACGTDRSQQSLPELARHQAHLLPSSNATAAFPRLVSQCAASSSPSLQQQQAQACSPDGAMHLQAQ